MKYLRFFALLVVACTAILFTIQSCDDDKPSFRLEERVLVANRNAGTVSVIDAQTDQVVATIPVTGTVKGEPMYIAYAANKIFVGDRANKNVHVYNPDNFAQITTIPCGNGVFHMWADLYGQQLWVNNDLDNTITVIDVAGLSVRKTISVGQKPHDVILSADGRSAFVSILSGTAAPDSIFQYNTYNYAVKAKVAVGKDPHLSLNAIQPNLYVPCQSGTVFVLSQHNLKTVATIPVPGAHGAFMDFSGKVFYTTNLPGGGTNALWAINTQTNTIIDSPSNAPVAVPHNLVVNKAGTKLYVTHSGGTSTSVTVYKISAANPTPVYTSTLTTDLNPFGIWYYIRKVTRPHSSED